MSTSPSCRAKLLVIKVQPAFPESTHHLVITKHTILQSAQAAVSCSCRSATMHVGCTRADACSKVHFEHACMTRKARQVTATSNTSGQRNCCKHAFTRAVVHFRTSETAQDSRACIKYGSAAVSYQPTVKDLCNLMCLQSQISLVLPTGGHIARWTPEWVVPSVAAL